jgi:hypothetical protein
MLGRLVHLVAQGGSCHVIDRIDDGALSLTAAVKVDQRCRGTVAHALQQLTQVGPGSALRVLPRGSGRTGEWREPRPPRRPGTRRFAGSSVMQRAPSRAGEDQLAGAESSELLQVTGDIGDDDAPEDASLRQTLDGDLPQQEPGTYQKGGPLSTRATTVNRRPGRAIDPEAEGYTNPSPAGSAIPLLARAGFELNWSTGVQAIGCRIDAILQVAESPLIIAAPLDGNLIVEAAITERHTGVACPHDVAAAIVPRP